MPEVFKSILKNRKYKKFLRSGLLTEIIEGDSFKNWLSDNKISSALNAEQNTQINKIIDRKPMDYKNTWVDFEKFKEIMHLISKLEESPDIEKKLYEESFNDTKKKKESEKIPDGEYKYPQEADLVASIVAAVTSKIPVKK